MVHVESHSVVPHEVESSGGVDPPRVPGSGPKVVSTIRSLQLASISLRTDWARIVMSTGEFLISVRPRRENWRRSSMSCPILRVLVTTIPRSRFPSSSRLFACSLRRIFENPSIERNGALRSCEIE
jgi:hypothetical protein